MVVVVFVVEVEFEVAAVIVIVLSEVFEVAGVHCHVFFCVEIGFVFGRFVAGVVVLRVSILSNAC